MRSKSAATVCASLAVTALAAGALPAGAAGQPEKGCPAGYNLGLMSFEQVLQHPKVQAALADGVTTIEHIDAVHAFVDKNGNGLLCIKDNPQWDNSAPVSGSLYVLVVGDDNAAVRP